MMQIHLREPTTCCSLLMPLLAAADTQHMPVRTRQYRELVRQLGDALDQLPPPREGPPPHE